MWLGDYLRDRFGVFEDLTAIHPAFVCNMGNKVQLDQQKQWRSMDGVMSLVGEQSVCSAFCILIYAGAAQWMKQCDVDNRTLLIIRRMLLRRLIASFNINIPHCIN